MAVPFLAIDKHQTNPVSRTPPVPLLYAAKTGNWLLVPQTFRKCHARHRHRNIRLVTVQTARLTSQRCARRSHCRDGCGESAYIPKKQVALHTSMLCSDALQ